MGTNVETSIELADSSGQRIRAELRGTCTWGGPERRTCEITLSAGEIVVQGSGSDYFDAFCRIREELETQKLVPVCYGASRHVWPSGMSRDMGLGLKAYSRRIGEPPIDSVLLEIFNTGPDVEPVSVAEQRAYAEAVLRGVSPKS